MTDPSRAHDAWRSVARTDRAWDDAPDEPERLVRRMLRAADGAAAVIREGAARRRSLVWESKGAADYVTEIDRSAESAIRDILGDAVPVLGEETWADTPLPAGWCFVADPLDGTTNFLHGFPPYAVSIGALRGGEPMAGLVLDVTTDARYVAVRGGGAYRDGMALGVSGVAEPARALVGTGIPFGGNAPLARYAPQLAAVARATAGIRRAGSAAMDLAWVAAGVLDAFWELHLAPWDVAAGLLLVREAGGIATTLAGAEAPVARGGVVAGNPAMHRWLLETLATAESRSAAGTAS